MPSPNDRVATYNDVLMRVGADSTLVPEGVRNSRAFSLITGALTSLGVFAHIDDLIAYILSDDDAETKEMERAVQELERLTGLDPLTIVSDSLRIGFNKHQVLEPLQIPGDADTVMVINKGQSDAQAAQPLRTIE